MKELTLVLSKPPSVPVDAKNISPKIFKGKSISEIMALPIREGNRTIPLSSIFEVKGEVAEKEEEITIDILGDLTKVNWVGNEMRDGKIVVKGSVGDYLGKKMSGGSIVVEGSAGSWVGMCMEGGCIEIKRNVRHFLGGGYRGSDEGMKGGLIEVHGNAGDDVGFLMAGGIIRVKGDVGQFLGGRLKNGRILVEGDADRRMGASMSSGRIIILGKVPSVLPSFIIDSKKPRVRVGEEKVQGPFYVFKGDVLESWSGSLYISINNNPHLSCYESYIV